ncbi:heat-inducible transcriptional repressor HrcA [Pleurocapsa sp. CCALA 161]|uniref:heat-inducible transcriptional repressor HrcA n=1 Tax=Pleurocapsa sp. CCALA 161 TaxID=2107688 RepID=UPI000D07D116|nr:heat-inducible transcriptional repressor HrcA [Pleurocapsa sp. CCALA 161]PSB08116.1 heat-inducible transcriptional repressor HrcA [Pleurocapsa sp. CCALA 161]
MVNQAELSARHQNILKATIKHYIATAEPVASKTLAQQYDFNVSSATIRNVMGRLESAGLLYQPHASAGRVPSDSGYRTYVDHLIVPNDNIDQAIQKIVQQELQIARTNFEALLQRAAKILATLSGYIALVTFPQKLNSTLRHIQLVPVAANQVMLIVVTDSYQTQSILMESPLAEEVDENTINHKLQRLSNFLDRELKGCCLADIKGIKWTKIDSEFAQYRDFLKILLNQLKLALQSDNSSPMLIHGVAELLRQPEFSQLQQVQTLLSLLEEQQEKLSPIIFTFPELESLKRVSIKIGMENSLEPMQTCTLVSANYYQDHVPVGSVGILGPKRMLYENAIALVKNTADYLSNPFQAFA